MNPSEAEEHLRVIRRLMERATIYRAISAPTALVGGLLSLAVGTVLHFWLGSGTTPHSDSGASVFFGAWCGVLILTGIANTLFLAREARRRGGSFVSPGMQKAFRALLPAFLAAAVVTVCFLQGEWYRMLPMVWMIFYGLALLAAAQISPDAIPRLGWAFLIIGLALFARCFAGYTDILSAPNLLMACAFGGLHLLYAVFTWSARDRDEGTNV